jgi:3-oxoacyl-[acyl-carrier protein] reductase
MKILLNKVAIVTGGSRGIGAAIAKRLGCEGAKVIVNYRQSRDAAEEVVEAIRESGSEAHAIAADVAKTDDIKQLMAETHKRFGGLDILINNAGYAKAEQIPIAETSDELFDMTLATNLRSVFMCMREAATQLREGGRVINVSSSGTAVGHPGHAAYTAAKSGVEMLTRIFAKEMDGRRVTVNCVSPGATTSESWLENKPQAMLDRIARVSPLNRLGTPEDVATVVGFLVMPEAEWINGQTIRVNGGYV